MSGGSAGFQEGWVEADGFRVRYMAAGEGPALVHLHGAGGLRLTRAHDLLCQSYRVIAFEMPGFGSGLGPGLGMEENRRMETQAGLAAVMAGAVDELNLSRVHLMGTSFGGKTALLLAIQRPELVMSLVLEAPAAIRPEGSQPVSGTPGEIARRLFAHPERMPMMPAEDPALAARRLDFVRRLRGPGRDPALEASLRTLNMPALVLFGTCDAVVPPDMGRIYPALMPNAHLVFVYDAGHAIAAERPEAFAEVVSDFLERGEAFVISRGRTVILP